MYISSNLYQYCFGKQRSAERNDGFTLLELLIIVAIVGVLAAVAAPSWQAFLDRQRMNSARGEILSILRDAQDEAQAKQQSREVFFSSTPTSPISLTVRNESDIAGGIEILVGGGEISSKYALTAPSSIVFDHDGRVNVPTPFVVTITNRDSLLSSNPRQSCAIVTTLLGGLQAANDDVCNNP